MRRSTRSRRAPALRAMQEDGGEASEGVSSEVARQGLRARQGRSREASREVEGTSDRRVPRRSHRQEVHEVLVARVPRIAVQEAQQEVGTLLLALLPEEGTRATSPAREGSMNALHQLMVARDAILDGRHDQADAIFAELVSVRYV